MNLLFYTSLWSFVALVPVWLIYDVPRMLKTIQTTTADASHFSLLTTIGTQRGVIIIIIITNDNILQQTITGNNNNDNDNHITRNYNIV